MPAKKRIKTAYPGVYYIMADGNRERIYYIRYRKDGKIIEEKAGRQFVDNMTPAKANYIRSKRIQGDQLPNRQQREAAKAREQAEANRWTIERLWAEYKARRPGLKGLVTDENRFVKHIKPAFGNKEPRELAPLDVDRLRLRLLKTHAPGTVKNVLELLRRIVNFGRKKRLCEGFSFTIEMPKVDNLKTEDLTPDQLARLLDVLDKSSDVQAAHLMKMALFTGMRRGELFRLKWTDIDFERGFIHLRDPKGGVDQTIPLNDAARAVLECHERTGSVYVFPGRGGGRRIDAKHGVNKIKQQAGLPKSFRPLHGLRHVFASMLASSGQVDMYTLQKLLTHKDSRMTQRYAHLRDDTLRQASNRIGDLAIRGIKSNVIKLRKNSE